MSDYASTTVSNLNQPDQARLIAEAFDCLDRFSEAFTAENREQMDSTLHFPHLILNGSTATIWNEPGHVPESFFDDLRKTGWAKTELIERSPIMISPEKVTFRYCYSRNRANGSVISIHENIWIVIKRDGVWGVAVRSY